ncbi:PQQ-dependent sugar dehydrogenase [Bacillus sp. DJP31]|uniref:PQQ-dependent sugar dehydrogenase n=1 Tax=Bacillus sp. DJP31 TaxID=3409789 RepID=UPI003BB7DD78
MFKSSKYILLLMVIAGCSIGNVDDTRTSTESEPRVVETIGSSTETLVTNLTIPWTIAKHEETFYITERDGRILEIDIESGFVTTQELSVTRDVHHEGEGGLLGMALALDFETTHQAYAYYTYFQDNLIQNRVVVLQKEGDQWIETKGILEGIPGGRIHNGGRMKLGPDGTLFVTTGDSGKSELSQDKNSLAGKILRMNVNGTIPQGNPFPMSYVYSYGHRNPQGLAWDDEGNLYSTEHGQNAHDEINLIKPGSNYGWPTIQGDEEAPDMFKPIFHTGNKTWAPSGIEYKDGQLYIATLRDSRIRSYDLKTNEVNIIHENSGRMRDVYLEGTNIYAITNNRDGRGNSSADDDRLVRIKVDY